MIMKIYKYSLTVLICVHTTNDYYDNLLLKALKTLENQTYKKFTTLIVLDTCWEHKKPKIINSNFDLNINFLEKSVRNGLHDAKNFGLSNIDTDLVAFLDGDDLYINNKIEKQLEYYETHDDVDFLGTQSWVINKDDEQNLHESCFKLNTNETHEELSSILFGENVLTHGSLMIRKKSLDVLGGYVGDLGREDWNLWHRALNHGFRFYQIQERLYIYRLYTGQER